jgi:predicted alpha/beta superfamily hydrolase
MLSIPVFMNFTIMKLLTNIVLIFLVHLECIAQSPSVSAGRIERLTLFPSKYVQARNIDVWLPPGYTTSQRYPVIFMQDGQMLFDSSVTWNKQEWQVDETIARLIKNEEIEPCIVVGIWNNGTLRNSEYFPEKALSYLPYGLRDTILKKQLHDTPRADRYLQFIVSELKPYIDQKYSTSNERSHTFIAGSSMGALLALYALCEYPKIFGGAACISTHWPGSVVINDERIFGAIHQYFKTNLPIPRAHKIYFDHGTATLDSNYEKHQMVIDKTIREKGYLQDNWVTKKFEGDAHNERSWSRRFHHPLIFLLSKK